MSPDDLAALRKRLNLSQNEFGSALGFADGRRRVRAWEEGYRNGEPYGPSASALAAITYLSAIVACLETELTAAQMREKLSAALPDFIREGAALRRGRF